jgi:plastocyanin
MRRPLSVIGASAVALLAIAALVMWPVPSKAAEHCGPDPGHTADAKVILQGTAFTPQTVTLTQAGQSVCWEHLDGQTPHSITSDAAPGATDYFDFPQDGNHNPTCNAGGNADDCFQQGDQPWKLILNTGGTYKYHCKIHPSMTGTIIVQGGAPGTTATTKANATSTTKAGGTATTVGTLTQETTTTVEEVTTSSSSSSSSTSSTIDFTTQTTSSESAAASDDDDDDEASGVLKAVGVVLLLAVIAGLIPAWRRLT